MELKVPCLRKQQNVDAINLNKHGTVYRCIGFPGSQVVVSVDWANKILRLVLVSTHTSVLLLFDVRVLAADY